MQPKKILILDDDDELRKILCETFHDYQFEVHAAATTSEAREIFDRQALATEPAANPFDVLLLDMELKSELPRTGADFGIAIRQQCDASGLWAPESLILSAYPMPDYFHKAIKLGAAGYLMKPVMAEALVPHVRALTLRRALRPERPGLTEQLSQMAVGATSRQQMMERFCKEILYPVLEASLSNRFLLLLTDHGETLAFSSFIPEVCRTNFCDQLQAAVFNDLTTNQPLVFRSHSDLPSDSDCELRAMLAAHPGSAFLRLVDTGDVRLSLGLIQENAHEKSLADSAEPLAAALVSYLSPLLVSHLIRIASLFTEVESEREKEREKAKIERQTLLGSIASFCRYFGQQLKRQLDEMSPISKDNPVFKPLDNLRELEEELTDAAELLDNLKDASTATGHDAKAQVETAAVTRQVVDELVSRGLASPGLIRVSGGCVVRAREDHLASAIYRILLWLARRRMEVPVEVQPHIDVRCRVEDTHPVISFEDRSRRLSQPLRQRLFEPFDTTLLTPGTDPKDRGRRLGLYLAKAMVEAEGGCLQDRSKDLKDPKVGHLFVMLFLQAP